LDLDAHPREAVVRVASVQVAIDYMADIGPEKPILALKTLVIDPLEGIKMILHALVVGGIFEALSADKPL
jgi:hypothetical protein